MSAVGELVVTATASITAGERPGTALTADDWFDQRTELGRGYRYLPRACQLLLAATRRVLTCPDVQDRLDRVPEHRRAVSIGTNHAVAALHEQIDSATVAGEARLLSPSAVPYFSPNLIASRVAMEHNLKAFSLGLHTPGTAGLEAIQEGLRAAHAGRADWLLVGAAESPPQANDAHVHTTAGLPDDGAVVLVLERTNEVPTGIDVGRISARSVFVPPRFATDRSRVEAALTTAFVGVGLSGMSVTPERAVVIDDGSPVAASVVNLIGGAQRIPAGTGALNPVGHLSEALTRPGAERVVVVPNMTGGVVVARAIPPKSKGSSDDRRVA